MAQKWVTKGLEKALKWIDDQMLTDVVQVRLYKNDYTPVFGSVDANFTEATFAGYGAGTLTRSGVEFDAGDAAHWRQNWNEITYTATGAGLPQTIYGYYIYDPGIGVLFAERFGTQQVFSAAGDNLKLNLYTTTKSEF